MNDLHELDISLTWLGTSFNEIGDRAEAQRRMAESTTSRLDDIENRLQRLGYSVEPGSQTDEAGVAVPRAAIPPVPKRSWDDLIANACSALESRGCDPTDVSLDGLLDEEEVRRIERRMHGGFQVRSRLDTYDIVAAVGAGLVATLVDAFIVEIPRNAKGEFQNGSSLTAAMRKYAADSDNWIADYAKISYDRVGEYAKHIEGFGGTTHRVQTFGHDPLLGLVYGTIDIMRGTVTAVSKASPSRVAEMVILDSPVAPVPNPLLAFTMQVLHLLSDLPTKMGLPLPGWTALLTINAGKIGQKEETIAQVARSMYLRGYDTWHFLTMATSVAAAELSLRGYWGLRGHLDEEWRTETDLETEQVGGQRVSDNPRFQTISLISHGIAAAGNAGKLALHGGNPVALNYVQWLQFVRSFFNWYSSRLAKPTTLLLRQADLNASLLDDAWPSIDAWAEDFPTVTAVGQP